MNNKEIYCALVLFEVEKAGNTSDMIRSIELKYINAFTKSKLKNNGQIVYLRKTPDRLLYCATSCIEAANLALNLRDTFLSINWKEHDYHDIITPKIAIHFGAIKQLTGDEEDESYILGANIDVLSCFIKTIATGAVSCTEDFKIALEKTPTNNTKFIRYHNAIYSLHWENEFIQTIEGISQGSKSTSATKLPKDIELQIHRSAQKELSALIKGAMCFNQGKIAQYSHRAAMILLSIKKLLKYPDRKFLEINKNIKLLHGHFFRSFNSIAATNFDMLKEIRRVHKKNQPLRVHSKIQVRGNNGSQTLILTYARDTKEQYDKYFPFYNAEENSATEQIIDTGERFLCNNIPYCAKDGRYKHPRLDIAKASELDISKPYTDEEWALCWKEPEVDGRTIKNRNASCFKSTLVIPMTLMRNNLPMEFWDELYNSISSPFICAAHADELERTIFGYLCIDSTEIDSFDTEFDVNIGYFFADILSLYYFAMHSITAVSEIYSKADYLIKTKQPRHHVVTKPSHPFH